MLIRSLDCLFELSRYGCKKFGPKYQYTFKTLRLIKSNDIYLCISLISYLIISDNPQIYDYLSDYLWLPPDICEIPARRNSYYEIATTNEVLEPSQRVVEGEQLILQCIDEGRLTSGIYLLSTSWYFQHADDINIRLSNCTASFRSSEKMLPCLINPTFEYWSLLDKYSKTPNSGPFYSGP